MNPIRAHLLALQLPSGAQYRALQVPHSAFEDIDSGHHTKPCEVLICLDNSAYEPSIFVELRKYIAHFISTMPPHYHLHGLFAFSLGTSLYEPDGTPDWPLKVQQMPTQYSMSYGEILLTLTDYVNQLDHKRQCQIIFITCSKEMTRPQTEVGEALMAFTKAAQHTRMRIHCIGVGADHDPYILEKLSLAGSGGSYRFLKITKEADIGPMMEQATRDIYYSYSIAGGEVCPLSVFLRNNEGKEYKFGPTIYYLSGAPSYILMGQDDLQIERLKGAKVRIGATFNAIEVEEVVDPILTQEALSNFLWRNLRAIAGHISNLAAAQTLDNIESFIQQSFDPAAQDMEEKVKSMMKKISINCLMAIEGARIGALSVIQYAAFLDSFYAL